MGKGSNTTSTSSTSSADPQASALYRDILARAQGVASTPYQAYTGDLTAPINSQQQSGISGINANAGYANPYIQQAAAQATSSSAPITGQTIQQYQSPYTQQVVDATTAQLRNEFGQQQAGLTSNAISQGALGGNAVGVGRGVLAGQQGRTMASTVAGLYDKSYQQALSAAQQQQATGLQGANSLANYGIQGQNAALSGATAQLGAGTLEQQTEQQRLNALYQQYAQAQAFPYQQTQWLAGLGTGVGSNLGGTSSGTTTGPAPNQTAQWLGAGLSAAALLSDRDAKEGIERIGKMNDGTPIYRFRYKGSPQWHVGPMAQDVEKRNPDAVSRGVDGYRYVDMHEATDDSVERASGGGVVAPWADVGQGWIPTIGIAAGRGAPSASAPSAGGQGGGMDPSKLSSGLGAAAKGIGGLDWKGILGGGGFSGDSWGGGSFLGGDAFGGSSAAPLAGLSAADYGEGFADGGGIMSDADPVGVAGGQQFAQASPWQMRPSGNGQVQVINVRTGQVVYTGTHAGAQNTAASMNARQRAAGGGVSDGGFNELDAQADVQDWLTPAGEYNFLDQQANPDPFGETNRIVAHDALRRGDGVINYGEPPVTAADGTLMGNQTSSQGVATAPAEAPVMAGEDDDVIPPTDTSARARGVAGGPGMPLAVAPNMAPAGSQDERFGLGLLPISKNAGHGMLTAGLGMLASRSPFLGNAVGEGALTGVAAYGNAEERDRKIAAEAQKLSEEARNTAFTQNLSTRKQDETERHNQATEKNARTGIDKLPPGTRLGKNGVVEVMPGVEDALTRITAARKGPQAASMDDDTAEFLADRVLAGDTKALIGLGRGAQGAENLAKIQGMVARKAREGQPVSQAARSILANAAQHEGLKTAERTQAGIMAKLSVYGRTAFNATDIAEKLSEEVPRTSFQPVNKILNAARTKTGDPKIVALGQALMTLTNEYARAIGGGHGTVHDKEAAEKRLSEAQNHEQLKAVINVMRQEILAEERAMPAARQHIKDIYNPSPDGPKGHTIAGEHTKSPTPGATEVPAAAQREVGRVYDTPKGKLKWNGTGWERP